MNDELKKKCLKEVDVGLAKLYNEIRERHKLSQENLNQLFSESANILYLTYIFNTYEPSSKEEMMENLVSSLEGPHTDFVNINIAKWIAKGKTQ